MILTLLCFLHICIIWDFWYVSNQRLSSAPAYFFYYVRLLSETCPLALLSQQGKFLIAGTSSKRLYLLQWWGAWTDQTHFSHQFTTFTSSLNEVMSFHRSSWMKNLRISLFPLFLASEVSWKEEETSSRTWNLSKTWLHALIYLFL